MSDTLNIYGLAVPATVSVADPTALALVVDQEWREGATAFVACYSAWFTLSRLAPLAAPVAHTIVRARSGAANWLRLAWQHPSARLVTTVYIDPANTTLLAADTNDGLSATTPLLTGDEVSRRFPTFDGFEGQVVFQFMSDSPSSTDTLVISGTMAYSGSVTISGSETTVITGTISAAARHTANATGSITTSNAASLAAYVGGAYAVRITSGAALGCEAPVLKDLGAGVASVGEFVALAASPFTAPTPATLVGNETFAIVRRTLLPNLVVDLYAKPGGAPIAGLSQANFFLYQVATRLSSSIAGNAYAVISNCALCTGALYVRGFALLAMFGNTIDSSNFFRNLYTVTLNFGTVIRLGVVSQIVFSNCASVSFGQGIVTQGRTRFYALNGTHVNVGNQATVDNDADYQWHVDAGSDLSFASSSIWWGTGNSGCLIDIPAGARAYYRAGASFPLTSSGDNFRLNGSATAAVLRTDDGTYLAPRALSFANLQASYAAGGFGGSIVALDQGNAAFNLLSD